MTMPITNAMRATMTFDDGPFTAGVRRAVATATGVATQASGAFDRMRTSVDGGVRSFDALRASIDPAFAASQKFAQAQRELAAMVELGSVSQRAANIALEQAASRYMGVATSAERAQQAERAAQAATQQATQNYEALRASLDPLYASSKRYEQAQETLAAAVKTGAVSQEQANILLKQAEARFLGVAPAEQAASDGQDTATRSASRLFATVGGGKMALKQTAFQLNQVAQQGAVTGNYLQALSIQSADMLTVFGTWGILAGGVIAVMGPVITSLITGGQKARSLDTILSDLSSTVGGLQGDFENAARPLAALEKQFGASAATAQRLYQATAALNMTTATADLYEATGKIETKLDGITGQVEMYEKLMLRIPDSVASQNEQLALSKNIVGVLADKYGLTLDNAIRMSTAQNALNAAIRANDMRAVAASATDMLDAVRTARDASGRIPPNLVDAAKASGQAAVNALQLAGYAEQAERLSAGLGLNMQDAADAAQRLASAISTANTFSTGLDTQIQTLGAEIDALKNKQNGTNAAMVAGLEARAQANRDAAVAAGEDAIAANARLAIDKVSIDTIRKQLDQRESLTEANKAGTSAANKAAREQERLNKQLDTQAKAWRDQLDPVANYTDKMAELDRLSGRLSAGEMAAAQQKLNVELADSLPLVGDLTDALSEGLLSGFKSGMASVGDLFKKWLAELIATAAKNQIVLSMGLGSTAAAASAAAANAAGSPAASVLQGAGTSAAGSWLASSVGIVKAFTAGITQPLSAAFSSAMEGGLTAGWTTFQTTVNASASGMAGTAGALGTWAMGIGAGMGFGTLLSNGYSLGGVSGSTASMAGTALGAVLGGPIGAAIGGALGGAITGLFGRKLKDTGIEGTFSDSGFSGNSYAYYKGGLLSSSKTKRSALDASVDTALDETISAISLASKAAAASLGVAADSFDGFAYSIKFSTKGLSDEEIQTKLEELTQDMADSYAGMIDGLAEFQQSGEGLSDTLARLSTAISSVNGMLDTLDYAFKYTGLSGGAQADSLAGLFGGLDDMSSAVSSYWDAFYSDSERQTILTRQATAALAAYNVQLPVSRDAYRALIEAQDLSTESGRALWAELVGLSDVMDQILPEVSSLTAALSGLVATTSTDLGDTIDGLTALSSALSDAASGWGDVSDSVSALIAEIRSTAGSVTTEAQAYAYNKAQYEAALAAAQAGDLSAAQSVPSLAKNYLASSAATAGSSAEARLAQAKVLAQLSNVGEVADSQEVILETLVDLQDQQITLLKALQSLLASGNIYSSAVVDGLTDGNGLTAAQLAEIQATNGLSAAQVAALANLGHTGTTQLGALQSIGAASSTQLATMASVLGISKSALNAALASNGLSSTQISALLAAKAIDSAQYAVLVGVSKAGTTQLAALQSIGAASASQLSAMASALGISRSALSATLASNGLSATQIATLLQAKAITASQLKALMSVYGLSADQLDALGSITNLSASELEAFRTGFKTLQGQTGTVQGLLSGIGSTAEDILTSATADDTVASLLRTGNKDLALIASDVSSLLGEMLGQARASAATSYLAGLTTTSAGKTYLDKGDLTQLASIYGVDTSGKSWAQVASAVAAASGSDTLSAGSYVLDLDGSKQAARARIESQLASAEDKLAAVVASITAFDGATAGDLVNGQGAVTAPYVNGEGTVSWSNGAPQAVAGYTSASLKQWQTNWWATGGLEDKLGAADAAVRQIKARLSSYAGGGYTGDGARSGGLDGQGGFLSVLHPQETVIDHTRGGAAGAGTGLDDLVAEIRGLARQVAALGRETSGLRQEQRQLGLNISENTRSMKNTLREWRATGVPVTGLAGGAVITKGTA